MIIYPSTQIQIGGETQVSARIELHKKRRGNPSELWFRFPGDSGLKISRDLDSFAVALLLLAMKNGEPLQVEGSLSRRLLKGLDDYQNIYHSWFPAVFQRIEIQPKEIRDDSPQMPSKVPGKGCAFSGGVDSFYSFLKLSGRVTQERPVGLTHAVFMAGFDMPLNLTKSIGELTHSYAGMMKTLGIGFIAGSTNVRNFVNAVDWTNAHGQALVATALFFKEEWNQFFIPSSYTSSSYPKWGSHPALDYLLSTDSLEIVHHGSDANRVRKLEMISQAPESHSRLRVCWIQDLGLKNCGQCEKCVRTQIALEILGALPDYCTFDDKVLDRKKVRTLLQRTYQARLFARELMWEAAKKGKWRILIDLGFSLLKREWFFRTQRRNRPKVTL